MTARMIAVDLSIWLQSEPLLLRSLLSFAPFELHTLPFGWIWQLRRLGRFPERCTHQMGFLPDKHYNRVEECSQVWADNQWAPAAAANK